MENQIVLKAGTRLRFGVATVTLLEPALIVFDALTSRDQVAETLAQDPQVFAEHRAALEHESQIEGRVVRVSYGVGGARLVEAIDEAVETFAPEAESETDAEAVETEEIETKGI